MELIYTASSTSKIDYIFDDYPFLVSLSSKNVLAFCTIFDIEGNKNVSSKSSTVTNYYIYVCDIDKPWYAHQLVTSTHKIVSLEWHPLGQKLFYADEASNCYVYEMKNLLNVWESIAHINLGDKNILQAIWLKHENKISFLTDRRDNSSYFDKFHSETIYEPFFSLKNENTEGIFLLTSSRLVLLILPEDASSEEFGIVMGDYTKAEGTMRICDVWLAEDRILVASSYGLLSSSVRIHSVFIGAEGGKLSLRCDPMTSFYVDHAKQNATCCGLESPFSECSCHQEIIFLKFLSCDSIIISYNINGFGHVELWQLIPNGLAQHSFFQKNYFPDHQLEDIHENKWKKVGTLSHNSHVTSIAVPQLCVVQQNQQQHDASYENNESFIQYVAVAYKDGSAKLANRQTFVWMATTHLDTGNIDEKWECPEKKIKLMTPHLVHMQQSYTGCILIGIDQNCCIYVMKAINTRDPVTQVSSAVLVGLFECLIMTSRDFWDVLAAVKPGSAEVIQHKLKENFKKQSTSIQDMHLNKLMSLNSLLAECLNNPVKAGENYCRSRVYLVNAHLKSRMLPKAIDSFNSERFSQICKSFEPDVENIIINFPSDKKFVSDCQPSNHLVHMLRWSLSLATYLVCFALPCTIATGRSYHSCTIQQIGCGMVNDANLLCAIRELVVLIKIWSNVSSNLLREYNMLPNNLSNTSTTDKLAQLFRLLTKMYQYALESKEADESFVEECLSFAEANPKFGTTKSNTGTLVDKESLFGTNYKETCSMFTQNLPLSFTFLKSPSYEVVKWRLRMDSVRQFLIDPYINCRICSRCGDISMRRDKTREWPSLPDSWEMKFEGSCCCGGMWRMNSRLKRN